MISRKRIVLSALAVGVAAGIGVGAFLARRERKRASPPHFPLVLPKAVSWANRSHVHRSDGTESTLLEAFAAEGKKFRLELAMEGKPAVVWIFDGTHLAANAKLEPKPPAQLDPRTTISGAYDMLPDFQYRGIERVGDHDCWFFERIGNGVHSRFWIDAETVVPRRVMVEFPDGRKDSQTYADLPAYRTHQPGLFDVTHLAPLLMPESGATAKN